MAVEFCGAKTAIAQYVPKQIVKVDITGQVGSTQIGGRLAPTTEGFYDTDTANAKVF